MQGTKQNPAQTFEGDTKDLKRHVNAERYGQRRDRQADHQAKQASLLQQEKAKAKRQAFDAKRQQDRKALEDNLKCTPRQARKKLRLGKKWDHGALAKAAEDEQARVTGTPLGSKHRKRGGSGVMRGPFKGPSKRPPGTSNRDWDAFMSGTKSTL